MKLIKLSFLSLFVLSTLFSCNQVPNTGTLKMKNANDSLSYALGYIEALNAEKLMKQMPFDTLDRKQLGKIMAKSKLKDNYSDFRKNQFGEFNQDLFYHGFLNEFVYHKSYFSEMMANITLRKEYEKYKSIKKKQEEEIGKKNLAKAEAFFEKNKKEEGVVEIENGLQYKIVKKGDGVVPKANDHVKCVYHGTTLDGEVFDSSKERGDTATLYLNSVIKGWSKAMQQMPEGSEWKVWISGNLAYGKNSRGKIIGPNEMLVFDINLVKVEK